MNHETAVSNAKDIADRVLAPAARQNDKEARFSSDAVKALGPAGLLGIMLPADMGGAALGPRTFSAVVSALAEADASVAMVYLMHVCATATIAAARKDATVAPTLKEIAAGRHLSTLAFSEAGSRSHFWAPVSRAKRNAAGVHITAKKSFVTSAGQAHSYVVSALAPEGAGPTASTLYLISSGTRGLTVAGPWDGLGLRANASAPMTLDDCEVAPEFAANGRRRRLPGHVAGRLAAVQSWLGGGCARNLPGSGSGDGEPPQQRSFRASRSEPRGKLADIARATCNHADRH